jgi:hypothetical protein
VEFWKSTVTPSGRIELRTFLFLTLCVATQHSLKASNSATQEMPVHSAECVTTPVIAHHAPQLRGGLNVSDLFC